jgi:hypothetical protein
MAQDFHAAFNVGTDDKHIAVVDEGGVALAAIQGLNQKLEEEAKAKDAEIAALKQSVAELKQLVQSLAERKWGDEHTLQPGCAEPWPHFGATQGFPLNP